MVKVLFVCAGNICRSPTAEGVFTQRVAQCQLARKITADSAGVGGWHIGEPPDRRAQAAALERGIDLSGLRARQVAATDFHAFDYVLAMDQDNLGALRTLRPADASATLSLFLDYAPSANITEVPDPYYVGPDGFEHVLDLVEQASEGLLTAIVERGV